MTLGVGLSLVGAGETVIKDLAGTGGGLTMTDDYRNCPDSSAANGSAWTSGINVVGGVGGTLLSVTKLGRLKSSSMISGPSYGFDASAISTFIGWSAVISTDPIEYCSQ